MRIQGRFLQNAVPPPLYPRIRDAEGLIEMESKPLSRFRVHRMLTGLYNGAEQLRERRGNQEPTTTTNPPFMLVYARHITTNTRLELTSFPGCPGLYYQSLHGLTLFVLDCPAVPSDSSYCHLRLLQAPEVHSEQAFTEEILARSRYAVQYSFLEDTILQEFVMSAVQNLTYQSDMPDDFQGMTLRDAWREAEARGEARGKYGGKYAPRVERYWISRPSVPCLFLRKPERAWRIARTSHN